MLFSHFPANRFPTAALILMLCLWMLPGVALANTVEKIDQGDKALALKKYDQAEKAYKDVLAAEPGNYRVMHSLAQVYVAQERYEEADALLSKILAMEVAKGKKVIVTLEGETEPLEAELVDETVILKEEGKNNMRNYLTPVLPEPVPHYRLFFFKAGKMELVPKHRAQIRYKGVPLYVREEVSDLQDKVKMKLIAGSGSGAPVEMVELQGGCFMMGSENGEPDEKPVHEVCVSPFKLDKHEVSQRQFQAKIGANPSRFKGADLPVESVTWLEAEKYCRALKKRLPTEAEWEFAARAGSTTEYPWGDTIDATKANYCDSTCKLNVRDPNASDGFPTTAPVGSFPANAFGLHDMAGNVNEWVNDWMLEKYYLVSPKQDPKGPNIELAGDVKRGGGNYKVVRGGSWENRASNLRSAHRKGYWVDYRIEGLGFRCAADL